MTATAPQIRSGIEACLKALDVDLAVFIQDVGIYLGYHVRLCVARIALCCFDISVVQLQLIGRAGVPERVKNHIRKVCVPFQPVKSITDHSILAGTTVIQR